MSRTRIMAPINTDLVGWAAKTQPEAAFVSVLILFILSIALLILCTSCKKHSFQLEEKAPEQKSSTLVSVARMKDARGANPAVNEITNNEIDLSLEPFDGNIEISRGGAAYRPWRSHTLTHGSSLQTQINGGIGTTTDGSVTLQGI
ncbi:uncharacterized protein si:ch73-204p21.2 isoform X2 [Myxocyprinus asiaticus]|uniref:uncharacterized protein si:ch73-204p21.2 isoform X2 n=1 Tax=Myxocyprinus asiaticus TaxID=70543 RepID=UPI002222A64E|nr:uncharacterized protein si:ch73-204p21.2 isoform X2 [Myxocyprinus asiaticus]